MFRNTVCWNWNNCRPVLKSQDYCLTMLVFFASSSTWRLHQHNCRNSKSTCTWEQRRSCPRSTLWKLHSLFQSWAGQFRIPNEHLLIEYLQNPVHCHEFGSLPDPSRRVYPSRWPRRASWPPSSSEQSGNSDHRARSHGCNHYHLSVLKKELDLRGLRPPPRHCLRGRMTFSQ